MIWERYTGPWAGMPPDNGGNSKASEAGEVIFVETDGDSFLGSPQAE